MTPPDPSPSPPLPGPPPRVGVVVVTWNKKDFVLRLLDDLAAHPYPNWTVLVVDSHSSDGTLPAIAERHPWVRLLPLPGNFGGSGGFNAGLREMLREPGLDYVWLLDNDVSLEPGALEVLVETLENRPDAGVAGSHMIQLDHDGVTNEIGGDVDLDLGRLLLREHHTLARFHRDEISDVDYVAACSLLVRFSVLRQVGLWDDFFLHYDDVDWCLRIRAAGHRVLACAASRIRHVSARAKPVTWVLYYDIRNMLHLRRRHVEFRPLRELSFLACLLYFNVRDELSGKGYYSLLVHRAVSDFVAGKWGKGDLPPPMPLRPARETLDALLENGPKTILVLEPSRQPVFASAALSAAAANGVRILGVARENDLSPSALPADAPRWRLSANRLRMAAQILRRAFFLPRAEALVLDVDRPCGLLGLCAKRILLVADGQCHDSPGGARRLLAALQWPFRWLPLLLRWLYHSPPVLRARALVRHALHLLRFAPRILCPRLALWFRLRSWPLLRRIKFARERLGDSSDPIPPAPFPNAVDRPRFRASSADELRDALDQAAAAPNGADVFIAAPRIELDESIRLSSGVRLVGRHDHATLVFRNVHFGIRICGSPSNPLRHAAVEHLAVSHESSPGGFSAAVFVANARDVVLDNLRFDSPCGIGLLVADNSRRVAASECAVRNAAQDGFLLLRDVVDFSADRCSISDGRQSGVLLADWPLPPRIDPLDFDAQLRHPAHHGAAFGPRDPAPCRILLRNCTVARHRKMGVCNDGSGCLSLENCRLLDNQCEGVTLDNGTWGARISRCEIAGNGCRADQSDLELRADFVARDDRLPDGSSPVKIPGVSLDNAALCRIEDSHIHDNHGEGVKFVRAVWRCAVLRNSIADNNRGRSPGHPHHGIRVGADRSQHKGQRDFPSSDNDLLDNRIAGPHDCGILLNEGTCLNRLRGNAVSGALAAPVQTWSPRANRISPISP